MITIVTRWESGQMSPNKEYSMWRQLKGAFKIDRLVFVPVQPGFENVTIDQFDTLEEALASCEGERVFLEPSGYSTMHEIPQGDIVLVLGNTAHSNAEYAQVNETYKIFSPGETDLYGINAASIALAIRYGQ